MLTWLKFCSCKSGATAVEYGLIVAILAAALLGGYSLVSDAINKQFDYLATKVFS